MKSKIGRIIKTAIAVLILATVISSGMILSYKDRAVDAYPSDTTQIRLYGEYHGVESYYDAEYELWKGYYNEGYRDLFIELPYYTAEFLNVWMTEDDDSIIDQVFIDLQGSLAGNDYYRQFFSDIKQNCPETVFHGTDIGHEFNTTGVDYLLYLDGIGQKDSPEYEKAVECIKQGADVYSDETVYSGLSTKREDYMVSNFIEAYDAVGGKVMGIYGSDHTRTDKPEYLYGRLREHYGDIISTVRISTILFGENEPYRFGFSVSGLVYLIMFLIPKLLWEKKRRSGGQAAYDGNKVLTVLAQSGQVALIASMLVFKSTDPYVKVLPEGIYFDWKMVLWAAAFVLMILYEIYGLICVNSRKKKRDLYSYFAGYPAAGITLPVTAAVLIGLYSMNLIIIAAAVMLGAGCIGIHAGRASGNAGFKVSK